VLWLAYSIPNLPVLDVAQTLVSAASTLMSTLFAPESHGTAKKKFNLSKNQTDFRL
jgi:hypothetical protein